MRTLCSEVQELVSASYDGQVTDPEAVTAATAHCAACAECAAFVTFLGSVREVPPPAAPPDAVARVLSAVAAHAETAAANAATEAASRETADADSGTAGTATSSRDDKRATGEPLGLRVTLPRTRGEWRTAAPWLATAAALIVGGVLVTAQGVDYLMSAALDRTARVGAPAPEGFGEQDASVRSAESGVSGELESYEAPGDAAVPAPLADRAAASRDFVAFAGFAYRMAGEESAPDGPPAGTVTSAFDAASSPQRRDAWTTVDSRVIIVDAGDGGFVRFERVERVLAGRTFGLAADAIGSFAVAVRLPASMPPPTSLDGSPTFVPAGTDDAGVPVFVRPGARPDAGFALAPGAESAEWTWWRPVEP